MAKELSFSIGAILQKGTPATAYKKVTHKILKEEAEKLHGISKQAENWSALAHHAVGGKEL